MDIKENMNMLHQDGAYCGNFDIWEKCFKGNERLFRRFEKKMRPRGYFLSRTFGVKMISLR